MKSLNDKGFHDFQESREEKSRQIEKEGNLIFLVKTENRFGHNITEEIVFFPDVSFQLIGKYHIYQGGFILTTHITYFYLEYDLICGILETFSFYGDLRRQFMFIM